jgi:hypothetical protein
MITTLLALVLLLQPLPPREPEPAYPYPAPASAAPRPSATWLDHTRVRITWSSAQCVLAERPSAGTLLLCDADGEVVLPDDVGERDTVARPQQGDRYCLAPGPPVCSEALGARPAREWQLALPVLFRGAGAGAR